MRYILIAFIIYIAYRFIFNFLIPVIITTRKVRKSFKEMNSRMQQGQQGQPEPVKKENGISEDDYIDYEEVDR